MPEAQEQEVSAILTGIGIGMGIVLLPCLAWLFGAFFIAWSDNRARKGWVNDEYGRLDDE
jgi:hypothetical protein